MGATIDPNELERVLAAHAAKYPAMQPTDAVKLIYQNEFGGGHLLSDKPRAFERLRQELAQTPQIPGAALYEDVGNGMLRVNLCALSGYGMRAAELFDWFCASAERARGSRACFDSKLDVLRTTTERGLFCFDAAVLEAYLGPYVRAGCPPVSHSEAYRRLYAPAYRIVNRNVQGVHLGEICPAGK